MANYSTNSEILNVVRELASPQYQNSIPVSNSPADYQKIFEQLMPDEIVTPVMNEFLGILLNKVLVQRVYSCTDWEMPFSMFLKDETSLGDTEELITLDVEDGEDYDGKSTLLEDHKPRVFVSYIYTTSRKKFPFTFSERVLRGAITKEYGIANMLSVLMERIRLKSDLVVYNRVLDDLTKIGNTLYLNEELSDTSSNEQNYIAQSMYRRILSEVEKMAIPSENYNLKGLLMNSKKGRNYLILNSKYKGAFDVFVLASLFNTLDVGEKKYFKDVIVAELSESEETDVFGYILDEDGYLIIPRLRVASSFYDGSNLKSQYYFHSWIKQGINPFAQAVKLSTSASGNSEITVEQSGGTGTVSNPATAAYGSNVTINITPPENMQVANVSAQIGTTGVFIAVKKLDNNNYVIKIPNDSVNVKIVYENIA